MKRISSTVLKSSVLSLSLCAGLGAALPTAAQSYHIVVPAVASAAPALDVDVTLFSTTLPAGMVNQPYIGYDFNDSLSVVGDPAFDAAKVVWDSAALPPGLTLTERGELVGTPPVENGNGSSFTVTASYLTALGQQVYEIIVGGVALQVTQISAGAAHTCAVTISGGAKCWGHGDYGQRGDGSSRSASTPVAVFGLSGGVTQISAGAYHTCAVVDGGAKCWGSGGDGQLGDGSITGAQWTPVNVSGLTSGVTQISAGQGHTCAIHNGGAKCWGYGYYGQLGYGSSSNQDRPINVYGLTDGVTHVSAGRYHTCAIHNGGAKCWGYGDYGQLGSHSSSNQSRPVNVYGLPAGVTRVSAGHHHTCAMMASGGAKCWGLGSDGQLGNGSAVNQYTPVGVSPE